ncbi:MAG: 6-phosphofructokinase [Anaerolineae bacterium]
MTRKGNLIVAQSGGPTVAINSSLVGVIHEALEQEAIGGIYGAQNGIVGVLEEKLIDLRRVPRQTLEGLRRTPAAALGTVRYKLSDADYERLLEVFRTYHVRYFLYNGGNDSMDTAMRIHQMARDANYELVSIGIPKTVDNDLVGTDFCPGYGSAARFVATAIRDTGYDTEAMAPSSPVKIMEVMGRNVGWLTAASVLARESPEDAPHLVYLPERPVSKQTLLSEVETVYRRLGRVVIALSEGARDEKGDLLGQALQEEVDVFGHRMKGGAADAIARLITAELGLKARVDRPNYLQRSFMSLASPVDLEGAYQVGRAAVKAAVSGQSGNMIALVRLSSSPYRFKTGTVPLSEVANRERPLPAEYIDGRTGEITAAFVEYARPLIGDPLPPYVRLPVHYVERP